MAAIVYGPLCVDFTYDIPMKSIYLIYLMV